MKQLLESIHKIVRSNAAAINKLDLKMDTLVLKDTSTEQETDDGDALESLLRRSLPIQNMDEFNALQMELKSNTLLRKKLCLLLTCAGGKDVKDTSQGMMRKLMTDELAQKFTYKGKLVGKARFAGTEISDILNASIRSVLPVQISTDEKIKECVSEWLTQAKFREQKRERRKRSQDAQPILEINLGQYQSLYRDDSTRTIQNILEKYSGNPVESLDSDGQ